MAQFTQSRRCVVFHRDETGLPDEFPEGPFYFKPVLAPYSAASWVGFETEHEAMSAAEAFEAEFGSDTFLPGECGDGQFNLIAAIDEFEPIGIGAYA